MLFESMDTTSGYVKVEVYKNKKQKKKTIGKGQDLGLASGLIMM